MAIKIKEVVPFSRHKSVFVAELDFMHGDADAYTDEELEVGGEDDLEQFVADMKWIHDQDPHYDRLGNYDDKSDEVMADPRFTRWFGEYFDIWPYDNQAGDYRCPAALDGVSYWWYDADGVRHKVGVE